jgi:Zn-dependent protease with chaperone function
MFRAFLSQSILHALVAALVVEALLRVWRIGDGTWRLRLRALALAAPLLWLPTLFFLAPFRATPFFVARRALFAGERWNLVTVGGSGLGDLLLVLAAGLGSALFLRDALPPLRDMLRGGRGERPLAPWQPSGAVIAAIAARHARALGIEAPTVRVIGSAGPLLLCEGARRPSLVVSTATVTRLSGEELDAAIAHEVAHAMHRDPAWGFGLIAVRALLFFNPAAQWVARTMVDDIERRADRVAVGLTGRAEPLARAIVALFQANHPAAGEGDASFERVFWRIRQEGVERRCQRLRAQTAWDVVDHGPLRMILATIAVLGLVFFVV